MVAELRTDARANRQRIVEAATEAFAERGLGVEMKEIAERAGVAVGTIYRHFPSKEELLTAIGRSLLADAIADAAACTALEDPLEGLTALLTGNLRRAQRYGWLIGAMIGGELPRHHLEQLKCEMHEHHHLNNRCGALIQRGIDTGMLRPDLDAGIATAMLEGVTMPWWYGLISRGRDPAVLAGDIMATFLSGAARREQTQAKRSGAAADAIAAPTGG